MKISGAVDQWADAHVFYHESLHSPDPRLHKVYSEERKWTEKLTKDSPNGNLLLKNLIFELSKSKGKIYVFHVTTNLDKITKSGTIYPSAGCLVGSIYCTPVVDYKGKLRLHNLGDYLYRIEAPRALKNTSSDDRASVEALLIELDIPPHATNNLIGIDYLRLGELHYNIYQELEYLLSTDERHNLENKIVREIKQTLGFLSNCTYIFHDNRLPNITPFFDSLIKAINYLPILGYLYFETVSEYLMLHQDDSESIKYRDWGEFYNWHYKNLTFNLFPQLLKRFKLSDFKPDATQLINFLTKNNVISSFNRHHFTNYLMERLIFLVNARLFSVGPKPINWKRIVWKFEPLSEFMSPLIGHLIHRELRSFNRFPNFYFYFDQYKALQIWNYWNHMDIALPFNGVIPKGEMGINPAYANLDYKIYRACVIPNEEATFVEPEEELDVEIIPKLVDLRYTFRRDKN